MINKTGQNSFYLQGKNALKDGSDLQTKNVVFVWNMLYQCNYRCPYCFFEGKWEEYGKRTIFKSAKEWVSIWKIIFSKYGICSIIITGGEPLIYPEFGEIIRGISEYHDMINITSNASMDFNGLVNMLDPKKISFTLSFHPDSAKLEDVIAKKKLIVSKGFKSEYINFVLYPVHMPKLNEFIDVASKSGETLKLIPFIGQYNGVSYPDGYPKEEKSLVGLDQVWESNVKRRGTLCAAGMKSALIYPDGKIARCGRVGERVLIGNIFSKDFELLKEPMKCDVDLCPCLEGKSIEE